jgi:hypothetical protein
MFCGGLMKTGYGDWHPACKRTAKEHEERRNERR